ncbi:MAG: threonine--tRNA ligase [Deltaproteobacteria bacterium]|nr:threonine--tRNA ligase [Deltaproteobacteria bacterium]MCB9786234.1 threonine--tRNA ligase [Deltaproteobacteria bacterium]
MDAHAHDQAGEHDSSLHRIRHSLAHVLAQAVLKLRPGSTLGFGPAIADGFYYDFILSEPLTEDDFPELEKTMKHIIKQNQRFEREELDRAEALARLDDMGEPYKREYAEELFEKKGIEQLSFYKNGPFLDMCEGPHVESTREIPAGAFKLRSLAGAYWRGDSDNVMMTRIYAWAFESREALDAHVKAYQDALARDHKKLGKELDLFVVDDEIGKGLPLWLPNGTVIRDELEKLARELEFKAGYVRVATPHIAKTSLYYKTGHLPYYASHMYPFMELTETREGEHGTEEEVRETYCLKPMNCPHHHKIFAARPRSYRDLPLRLAEYGQVYRFEDSGALSGLLRVRGMAMNDAHIYCTEDQVKSEFLAVMRMHQEVYDILGLTEYYFRFSTWDPEDPKGKDKYIDDPEGWETTQRLVHEAMVESGARFVVGKGEAAFYGPKIDVQFKTVTGREETASTNQLDFGIAQRLGLEYVGPDNQMHRPYIIHRAPLGTHERFVAFLIEHYGGAFPTWLAPVQVRVLTVGERFDEHAEKLVAALRGEMVRAEMDRSSETMGKKIRNAVTSKIPNVLVVGEREVEDGTVTLRRYGVQQQETLPFAAFQERLLTAIRTRSQTI